MKRIMKMWLAAGCTLALAVVGLTFGAPTAGAQAAPSAGQFVTWNCTSSPCSWGNSLTGYAATWTQPAVSQRLGYTTTQPVYLPASRANGMTVTIASGSAGIYVGTPQASSHSQLVFLSAGQSHTINGLATDTVMSIQSGANFTYTSTPGTTTTTTTTTVPATTTTTTVPATTTTVPATTTTTTVPATTTTTTTVPATTTTTVPTGGGGAGQFVTWNCTSSPCSWGNSLTGYAATWTQPAVSQRLGYTTTQPVYLPASRANGMTVTIASGSAGIYVGTPQASSHSQLVFLSAGQSHTINGLATDTVMSIQSGANFTYTSTPGTTTTTTTTTVPATTTTTPRCRPRPPPPRFRPPPRRRCRRRPPPPS